MSSFLVIKKHGDIDGGVIRAESKEKAMEIYGPECRELKEIPDSAANAMGVPDQEGYFKDCFLNWLRGPTNLLGEVFSNKE